MQAAVQEVQGTQIAIILAAIAIVAFWRTILKFVIMLVAIAIIAAVGYGVVVVWQSTHQHIAG
jgi:predicted neutral ceramidase superfamily lipid hydrolase